MFMYPSSEKQILLAMILCVLFIILYSWMNPFLDPIHNFIIGSAKWGIFLQLYGTLLLKQNQFDGSYNFIGDLLIAVGVLFPLLPLISWRGWIDLLKKLFKNDGGEIRIRTRASFEESLKGYLKNQGELAENPVIDEKKQGL